MNNYEESLSEDRDAMLNSIFNDTSMVDTDDPSELEPPALLVDLDEVNGNAIDRATDIIEHLSGYYIDERYIREHPYIKNKITQEIDNIRRLLKMLSINEKAQDTLIQQITMFTGKSALYSALTALQTSILNIQKQLDDSIKNIEDIFKAMQDECKATFDSKEKENLDDGSIVCRGTRDFLKELALKISTDKINQQSVES